MTRNTACKAFFFAQCIQWKCISFDVDENICRVYEKTPMFILDENPRKLGTEGLCLIPCSWALCKSWLIWVSKWYFVPCRHLTFVIRRPWQTSNSFVTYAEIRLEKVKGSIWLCLDLKTWEKKNYSPVISYHDLIPSCTGEVPVEFVVRCEFSIPSSSQHAPVHFP